jgi:hypothetical protein
MGAPAGLISRGTARLPQGEAERSTALPSNDGIAMRRTIEHLFEAIETNASYPVFAMVASFAVTGCLRLFWE